MDPLVMAAIVHELLRSKRTRAIVEQHTWEEYGEAGQERFCDGCSIELLPGDLALCVDEVGRYCPDCYEELVERIESR